MDCKFFPPPPSEPRCIVCGSNFHDWAWHDQMPSASSLDYSSTDRFKEAIGPLLDAMWSYAFGSPAPLCQSRLIPEYAKDAVMCFANYIRRKECTRCLGILDAVLAGGHIAVNEAEAQEQNMLGTLQAIRRHIAEGRFDE